MADVRSLLSLCFLSVLFVVIVVVGWLSKPAAGQGNSDQTMTPYAKGADTVEATCDRITANCIFESDKMMTRRMAYTESSDGTDSDTFRPGYYGGIWLDRAVDFFQEEKSNDKIDYG